MMEKAVAIFGYNNTRLYDVRKIKSLLSEQGLSIVLCKEGITKEDRSVSEHCFDMKLEGSTQEIAEACSAFEMWLFTRDITLVGILPFSDKGIILASYVAEKNKLISDAHNTAITGLNKILFRDIEAITPVPSWYQKPKFMKIQSIQDIENFYNSFEKPIFIKPACEGNSRGCILVESVKDFENAFNIIQPYLEEGVIAEEYVSNAREFSFDTVAGKSWITEKETTQGYYRAEIQQIVPAPLKKEEYERLIEAGKLVASFTGSNNGAAHNELFLLSNDKVVAVEPNRRPAGMHIWDLASHAFKNFKPFQAWIDWSIGKQVIKPETLEKQSHLGIRMIKAKSNGVIVEIDTTCIDKLKVQCGDILEINLLKNINDTVSQNPKDNAGFIGYIIAKHKDPIQLKQILLNSCNSIANSLKINSEIVPQDNHLTIEQLHTIEKLRENADKEEILILNCDYICPKIEEWWAAAKNENYGKNKEENEVQKKTQLKKLLLNNFRHDEQEKLKIIGSENIHITGVTLEGLFKSDDLELAHLVDKVMVELVNIHDIKYPYEDHKEISITKDGIAKKEWSRGTGVISPHCDDLYEGNNGDKNTDVVGLTVCRNESGVPTLLYPGKGIFQKLNDNEIARLLNIKAVFKSGINVKNIIKEKKCSVLSCEKDSFSIAFDYRIDEKTGPRMLVENQQDLPLIKKIESQLIPQNAVKVSTKTGSVTFFNNHKALHAREAIKDIPDLSNIDLAKPPRCLIRSKGPKMYI